MLAGEALVSAPQYKTVLFDRCWWVLTNSGTCLTVFFLPPFSYSREQCIFLQQSPLYVLWTFAVLSGTSVYKCVWLSSAHLGRKCLAEGLFLIVSSAQLPHHSSSCIAEPFLSIFSSQVWGVQGPCSTVLQVWRVPVLPGEQGLSLWRKCTLKIFLCLTLIPISKCSIFWW